jgi:hypothetical protein
MRRPRTPIPGLILTNVTPNQVPAADLAQPGEYEQAADEDQLAYPWSSSTRLRTTNSTILLKAHFKSMH